jgi:hypothetical protein
MASVTFLNVFLQEAAIIVGQIKMWLHHRHEDKNLSASLNGSVLNEFLDLENQVVKFSVV